MGKDNKSIDYKNNNNNPHTRVGGDGDGDGDVMKKFYLNHHYGLGRGRLCI